jgi:exosome complex exonuclease RRP6
VFLFQISTRKQDYVVDTLALRRRMPELGVIFADPKVVKVLHGCDKDVLWLQRDLGLYLVNCFDTHVAAKALSYPALSLAHLLKMHCGVTADKKHQLSDWRLRPLSPEMLHYAKEDTHYLLYVFDRMRQELWMKLGQAGVEQVFSASKQLCLARYEKPRFNPLGYKDLFRETASSRSIPKLEELSSLQDAALCSLWDWRDRMARDEDDSCAALVSNAELLRIGVHLPQTGVQLEQLCGPLSPFTRKHTADILRIVSEATSFGPSGSALNASSGTDADTFASPSSKKAKSAVSMPATTDGAAAPKLVVPDSVYTFTPAVVTPKIISGRLPSASELLSPVLRTDEVQIQLSQSLPCIFYQSTNILGTPF